MSPHAVACAAWSAALAAALVFGGELKLELAVVATTLFVALVAHGVASIRSPFFGRARLRIARPDAFALTFDDGPDPQTTPVVLDLLRERGAQATFFVVGEKVRRFPELVRRIHEEGHALGNHSDRHSWAHNFRLAGGLRRDLVACQEAVEQAAGVAPRLFRPPVGLRNPATHRVSAELGLELVGWSIRSLDTTRRSAAEVSARVHAALEAGAIVLLHDGGRDSERTRAITTAILEQAERLVPPLRSVALGQDA